MPRTAKNDDEKPNGKPAQEDFDDSEFFKAEGIDDDDEKDAIRSRARVHRYVKWRESKETESKPKPKSRRWYESE